MDKNDETIKSLYVNSLRENETKEALNSSKQESKARVRSES